jgi:predicted aconitase
MKKFVHIVVYSCLAQSLAAAAGFGGYFVGKAQGEADKQVALQTIEGAAMRQIVAHHVIEGRMSLAAATEQFRAISKGNPHFSWEILREVYPGETDDERLSRQVIAAVYNDLSDQPEQAKAVVARLEAELAGYPRSPGK